MDIDVTIGNDVTMKGGALAGLGHIDQYELLRELGDEAAIEFAERVNESLRARGVPEVNVHR